MGPGKIESAEMSKGKEGKEGKDFTGEGRDNKTAPLPKGY